MRRAIYPGSFDPLHNGHLDVLRRAARLFDEVIVAVAFNDQKKTLFSPDERVALLDESAHDLKNVRVAHFDGLLVEFTKKQGAGAVIRGLRAVSDFEFEFQMALMNRRLSPGLEIAFLMPSQEYTYLNSTLVKEVARHGGRIRGLVPAPVETALLAKFGRRPVRAAGRRS